MIYQFILNIDVRRNTDQPVWRFNITIPEKVFVLFPPQASKVSSSLLSSKARKVSSLVQKWQSIKQQEEPDLGSSEEEEEENDPARQIEDWKKEHLAR